MKRFVGNIKFNRRLSLVQKMVFCDAISSSGKGMLSHIISSFKNVELQRNDYIYDQMVEIYLFNKISEDAAVALLRAQTDEFIYNSIIGRNLNFRPTDDSSVYNNANPNKYIRRLYLKDGARAVNFIKNKKPILSCAPHNALSGAEIFFKAFGKKLKFIHIIRNPIETIEDWTRRGAGHRIGNDPREFKMYYTIDNINYPLWVNKFANKYKRMSDEERNTCMIRYLFDRNYQAYLNLSASYKKNVLFILFDDLIYNPNLTLNKLASFLNTKQTKYSKEILVNEHCPRPLRQDHGNIKKKLLLKFKHRKAFVDLEFLLDEYKKIYKKIKI